MTPVTCRGNRRDPTMLAGMTLLSLLVCMDEASVEVLKRVLEELGIQVELCSDPVRAAVRLAQQRYDLIILDCDEQSDVTSLLHDSRSSRLNDATLAVAVVGGQENIREMFTLGVNFVLYKPVSYERALSTLRAAQSVLFRDKRRKARATVHTHATLDYAGGEQVRATLVDLAEDGMAVNLRKKAAAHLQSLFPVSIARTDCDGASLGCGRVAGLEWTRGNSVSRCPANFAACAARMVATEDCRICKSETGGGRNKS